MSRVRDRAWLYMSRVPKDGLSSRDDSDAFDALVGKAPGFASRQDQMKASNYVMTFCNEFAGECGRSSIHTYVGALDLRTWVKKSPRPYAWVEPSSGSEPKKGDILYIHGQHQHLAVAVEVKGNFLYKVEAGQGGAKDKQDFLKWTKSPWPSDDLVGWLDIDLWEYGPGYEDSQPDVEGDWTVWGDKRRFRWAYKFNADDATVTWRDVFNGMHGKGTWRYEKDKLFIQWKSGSTDEWRLPLKFDGTEGFEDMKGEGKMDIFATKP